MKSIPLLYLQSQELTSGIENQFLPLQKVKSGIDFFLLLPIPTLLEGILALGINAGSEFLTLEV